MDSKYLILIKDYVVPLTNVNQFLLFYLLHISHCLKVNSRGWRKKRGRECKLECLFLPAGLLFVGLVWTDMQQLQGNDSVVSRRSPVQ